MLALALAFIIRDCALSDEASLLVVAVSSSHRARTPQIRILEFASSAIDVSTDRLRAKSIEILVIRFLL